MTRPAGSRLVSPGRVAEEGWTDVADGRFAALGEGSPSGTGAPALPLRDGGGRVERPAAGGSYPANGSRLGGNEG